MSYTTTFTGRHVSPESGVPALLDIAVGLARIVRFGGQGKRFFSVLAHTLWMEDLYCAELSGALAKPKPAVRLGILLHDAHECILSDVPSPMKTLDMKQQGYALDARIFDRYFAGYGGYDEGYQGTRGSTDVLTIVKGLDYRCLLAEYWNVGPAQPNYLDKPDPFDAEFLSKWLREAGWLRAGHGMVTRMGFSSPPWQDGENIEKHPAVREYLRRINTLL